MFQARITLYVPRYKEIFHRMILKIFFCEREEKVIEKFSLDDRDE